MGQLVKLDKKNIEDMIALTPMQEGMLFHYLKQPKGDEYFEQLCLEVSGIIDTDVFDRAWSYVVKTNEMLRTVFRWEKLKKPIQIVLKEHKTKIFKYDLTEKANENKGKLLNEIRNRDRNNRFDLRDVAFRVTLCILERDKYQMIISNHHILYDGWSTGIILKEFFEAYNHISSKAELDRLPKNKFKHFIKHIKSEDKAKQKTYWKEYLKDFNTPTHLFSSLRKDKKIPKLKKIKYNIPQDATQHINSFVKERKITLAALLYSAWGILLQRYTNSDDVVFGTTLSGRNMPIKGIENMVGLFINTLPLRVRNNSDNKILNLLKAVNSSIISREKYENTPLIDIKKYSDIESNEELFNSIVVIENYPLDNVLNNNDYNLWINSYNIISKTNFDLTLGISTFDGIKIELLYNKALFAHDVIERICGHFETIILEIIGNAERTVNEIDILRDYERKQLLYDFNDNHVDYLKEKTLHQLFQEQVERTPDNIALIFNDRHLTYRELNERSNQLARRLREKGVEENTVVGIMVERSLEMIVGIMGILKAGGAYLPIDPRYPKDRIEFMLKDSSINILLVQSHLKNRAKNAMDIVDLEDEQLYRGDTSNLKSIGTPKGLAYVIYTSGTTGNPKGVMIEHRSISSSIQWRKDEYKLSIIDNVLQLFSFSFDGFLTSLFTPIISGAKVIMLKDEDARDPIAVKKHIFYNNITHFISVPSLYMAILEASFHQELESLKIVTLAGERVGQHIIRASREKNINIEIANEYGPTEGSVVSTIARDLDHKSTITIGKPIANRRVYIMDSKFNLQPIGVAGELCIGGDGLARGYLNRQELTEEKFIDNPYIPGERIYKTGDLARWLPSGNIEFIGRIDNQVKIRGYRIELGEIENKLQGYEGMKEAAVAVKGAKNNRLCAYIVSNSDIDISKLKSHLSEKLPQYMIPSCIIEIDKLPLTANGKIDRKLLPEPSGSMDIGAEYEAPRTELEEDIAKIWQEVLEINEAIGINDNFFHLGGHSLNVTSLVARIHKALRAEIPLQEIFKNPTIKQISSYIDRADESIYNSIEAAEEREYYPLSSAQKRLYILNQFSRESTNYNMSSMLVIEGPLNRKTLENVFKKMIERHESLRTSFHIIDERPMQKIHQKIEFKIDYKEGKDKELEEVIQDFIKPFDLSNAPLLRVCIIKLTENKYILMTDMHHIISDGASTGILISEFSRLYNNEQLPPLRIQYKDYALWQQKSLKTEKFKKQEEYWLRELKGELSVLNLPTDYYRPNVQSFEGDDIDLKIGKGLAKKLRDMAKEAGITIYMLLLGGYNILLSKYTLQEDIIIGSPIAARHNVELDNVIGIFVNTLVMRNYPNKNKTVKGFLQEVKENCLGIYENQDYQFEDLVEKLDIKRDTSRNPIFDVMFSMPNVDLRDLKIQGLKIKPYEFEDKTSKFDLMLTALEGKEEINVNLQYCTRLFKRETIERLGKHFINILEIMTKFPEIKIGEIDMLGREEKRKLLADFNNTKSSYPGESTIHELFEGQVERTPDNIAVVYKGKQLTYKELNEKSNQLARRLRAKGVDREALVGIMADKSLEMIIGIMGILKAGGGCIPIDPEYPKDRIEYMLQDSKTNILLTQSNLISQLVFKGDIVELDNNNLYKGDNSNLEIVNEAKDLLYLIYTSGSTGKPKGTMLEHRNLVNLINFEFTKTNMDFRTRVLQFTTISFDVCYQEIFSTLLRGGELYIIDNNIKRNVEELLGFIDNNYIETVFLPTSYLKFLIRDKKYMDKLPNKIKHIIVAGEQLIITDELKKKLRENRIYLHNHYGPSEAHVVTTLTIDPEGDIEAIPPIGKPISNTKLYILSKDNQLQPLGIPGELCIAGDCVGRGYINMEELTKKKFIDNPFNKGERMYKTGDLARWLQGGNIEFLGRIDNQVKIRGYRIELGEIENKLQVHDEIKEAVITAEKAENGDKYLCSYIVPKRKMTAAELRKYLSKELPEYMIPSYFIELKEIPLTKNGKVDTRALPRPKGNINTGIEYEGPRNEREEILVGIWEEILSVEKVGINDDFFDLGGHSLKAMTLVSKIHKELNAQIPLQEVFKNPSIKGISEYIKSSNKNENMYNSIKRVDERKCYPLSSAQKRMYILNRFNEEGTNYNMPWVLEIEGELNIKQLENAFKGLIERHEALRTSFEKKEEYPVQIIHREIEFKIEYREAREEEVENIIEDFIRPFDLSKEPLFKARIVRLKEEKHILMTDMHHIISDGVSVAVLIGELKKLYRGEKLGELRIQYRDYALWQRGVSESKEMKKQGEYWINRFKGEIPQLNLTTDYKRQIMQSFEGSEISFRADKELTEKLKRRARQNKATLYMVLLSAYNALLYRYTGQEDIIVGTPAAGRPHADLQNIIGIFVNTLAMRNSPRGEKTFRELLIEVKENALGAYENQGYQFEELVEGLDIKRDISRNTLFDTMFTLQNMDMEEIEIKGLKIAPYNYKAETSKFDLSLGAVEGEEGIQFSIQYCTRLFKEETVRRFGRHYINILKEISENPEVRLREIRMMSEKEEKQILIGFNDKGAEYPRDRTIHQLFEEQVERTPEKTAVVFEDKELSYRQLNQRANSLARQLRGKGIGPDTIVGIMVERSLEMIVGIIAILKAGGAYLPIDTDYPKERISFMLQDSNAEILLITKSLISKGISFHNEVVCIDDEKIYKNENTNLDNINSPYNLAYIIYTSGTTGIPKGVMIEHRNVVRLMFNDRYLFDFNSSDIWTMFHSYCFDFSVWEMYGALLYGAKLIIISKMTARDTSGFLEILRREKVTILNQTPSAFYSLIKEALRDDKKQLSIRYIIFGGEALTPGKLRSWKEQYTETKLINMYGITETTVHVTFKEISFEDIEGNISNIGKAIPTLSTYVMDKDMNLLPIGISGELFVGGEGVARGYINRTELTKTRFISNPYNPREILYKSGDLVRLCEKGYMEYLGRIDNQVKIRGYRIELGEIQNKLQGHKSINEAVVMARETEAGEKYLCAYMAAEKELSILELRNYLSKKLPKYMIPSYFTYIEKMPLTSNGKIDAKALPEPVGVTNTGVEYEAPRNELEEILVRIWQEVLGIKGKIGINHDFFDLGGHSLKATTLVARVHKELKVELPLQEIFKGPSIKRISEYIDNAKNSIYKSIKPGVKREYYPLSSAQKRMFILNQLSKESTNYNMPSILELKGILDKERFQRTFEKMVSRHEALRTSFEMVDGEAVQKIHEEVDLKIEYMKAEKGRVEEIIKNSIRPFDLKKAPLLKVIIVKITENRHLLITDIHHIISDGVSIAILISEFLKLYEGEELPELRIQYKDYALWQQDMLESYRLKKQEKYWLNRFKEEAQPLNMPTDYRRPRIQSFEGESIDFTVDEKLTNKLYDISKENKATLYMVLLALYNTLLYKNTGQEDIVVGTPIAGRPHADMQNIIGMFVNTLAMRNNPAGDKSFKDFLLEVKENALGAYENQDYQFEELIDKLEIKRDLSRNPLFDTMLNLRNVDEIELELGGLSLCPLENKIESSKFDIKLAAEEREGVLEFTLEYSTKLFKRSTMEKFIRDFIKIIEIVTKNCSIKLSNIDVVSKQEKNNILLDFNDDIEDVF